MIVNRVFAPPPSPPHRHVPGHKPFLTSDCAALDSPACEQHEDKWTSPRPDPATSRTFLYSNARPVRDYQLRMALTAAKRNTLVVLPTGMGKTFVASMVILNFRRWFPGRKIIFFAPTRPLLKQQIQTIRTDIGLTDDYAEISGGNGKESRTRLWREKELFFATPQTVEHDITNGICKPKEVSLMIFDEAHRARRDYSYCKVINAIYERNSTCRIIGLTATPGMTVPKVEEIVVNMKSYAIEYCDCAEYTHLREIETIMIERVPGVEKIEQELHAKVYPLLTKLKDLNIIRSDDTAIISKGALAAMVPHTRGSSAAPIVSRALRYMSFIEKLEEYSLVAFRDAIEHDRGRDLTIVRTLLLSTPDCDPKIKKMVELVQDELNNRSDARIMIFCNYRSVIDHITSALRDKHISCSQFVGQAQSGTSKGQAKTEQQAVVNSFKEGILNVLVTTSIGEEGLDIGEVDLIICYDIQKSVTRMVQRIGRTGRQRAGRVVFLLNAGSRAIGILSELDGRQLGRMLDWMNGQMQIPVAQSGVNDDLHVIYKNVESMSTEGGLRDPSMLTLCGNRKSVPEREAMECTAMLKVIGSVTECQSQKRHMLPVLRHETSELVSSSGVFACEVSDDESDEWHDNRRDDNLAVQTLLGVDYDSPPGFISRGGATFTGTSDYSETDSFVEESESMGCSDALNEIEFVVPSPTMVSGTRLRHRSLSSDFILPV